MTIDIARLISFKERVRLLLESSATKGGLEPEKDEGLDCCLMIADIGRDIARGECCVL